MNFKLTNVQSAMGLVQLARLTGRLEHRRELRRWYAEELDDLAPVVVLPAADEPGGETLAWIDVLVDERDALAHHLATLAIESRPFWKPVHAHGVHGSRSAKFPNATWVANRGIWLPSALSLSRSDVARVAQAVRAFVGGGSLATSTA